MNKDYRQALIDVTYQDVLYKPDWVADDPLAKDAAHVIKQLRLALDRLRAEVKRRGEMLRRAKGSISVAIAQYSAARRIAPETFGPLEKHYTQLLEEIEALTDETHETHA